MTRCTFCIRYTTRAGVVLSEPVIGIRRGALTLHTASAARDCRAPGLYTISWQGGSVASADSLVTAARALRRLADEIDWSRTPRPRDWLAKQLRRVLNTIPDAELATPRREVA